MEWINYQISKYNFREIIEEILNKKDLEHIHQYCSYELYKKGTDQHTEWHKLFYKQKEKFLDSYERLIYDIIKPSFSENVVYQKIPTFRIQLVNNLGVFEFHKDKSYQHNCHEVNFFLPITNAYNTNTIWVESEEDKGDYSPMNTKYGQIVKWNGNYLTHGNKQNKEKHSRVSVDFRVIPLSKYNKEEGKSSIYSKMKFTIGDYYKVTK